MSAVIGVILAVLAIWFLIKLTGIIIKVVGALLLIGAIVFIYFWIKQRTERR